MLACEDAWSEMSTSRANYSFGLFQRSLWQLAARLHGITPSVGSSHGWATSLAPRTHCMRTQSLSGFRAGLLDDLHRLGLPSAAGTRAPTDPIAGDGIGPADGVPRGTAAPGQSEAHSTRSSLCFPWRWWTQALSPTRANVDLTGQRRRGCLPWFHVERRGAAGLGVQPLPRRVPDSPMMATSNERSCNAPQDPNQNGADADRAPIRSKRRDATSPPVSAQHPLDKRMPVAEGVAWSGWPQIPCHGIP